eukprot:m.434852 g.434852  ORF g.434852 m.434852 type:complete len:203 (+) comp17778_c0_seq1:76-684(+)
MVDGKLIGAAIGAVTLIFAMATNSTTDNFRLDINGAKIEVGIWMLAQTSDPKDDPAKPRYCDQTESNSKCRTGNKDDDCCIALRDKCNTLKTFAVFSAFAAAGSIAGFVMPPIGMGAAAFNALCNLILFSVTASLVNGKYYKTEFSELNKDADCGFNKFRASASSDSTTTAGAGLALCVISFILCIVQIVMYKSASASVSPA